MEITDPTDWPGEMPELRTIDSLLRCAICYEFLNTAMILPGCSHNFCSLCIRRYLTQESKCPSCKKPTAAPELKNNRVLDELIKNFVAVRPHVLKLCLEKDSGSSSPQPTRHESRTEQTSPSPRPSTRSRRPQASQTSQKTSSSDETPPATHKSSPTKQSRITKHFCTKVKDVQVSCSSEDSDDDFVTTPSRSSKPSMQRSFSDLNRSNEENIAPDIRDDDCMIVDDDEGEASTSSDSRHTPTSASKKDKASCPVCGVNVHSKYINTHLDACLIKGEKRESKRRTPNLKILKPKRKPLPKLVYNLMSDRDLRKKLKEFKMSHQGSKQVLVRRLNEFTLLYNAECDSDCPKPVEALVKEVEKMEKVKVQQPSKREQRVTKLKVEKGQTEEEMEKHQKEYLKAHKNQFDKLVQEARERMKKVRNANKKSSSCENKASTSSSVVDDENSRDSVTITEIKDGKETPISGTGSGLEKQQLHSNVAVVPEGTGYDRDLATVETVADDQTVTGDSPNGARVSLSFAAEVHKSDARDRDREGACYKKLSDIKNSSTVLKRDTLSSSSASADQRVGDAEETVGDVAQPSVSSPVPPGRKKTEQIDKGTSSTESLDEKTDESLEESSSPSLLSSQAVLGDNANYSVSIRNQDDTSDLGRSGLLDTLMSEDEPGISGNAAVLVPSSPSTTSKGGDEHPDADTNQLLTLEDSEVSSVHQDHNLPDSVDLSCIPESPQPSTSGIRQRKRKKVDPSNNSESGSSVGDDSVGLRRSRRTKKSKPNS